MGYLGDGETIDGTKLMSRWVTCIGRPHEVEVTGGGGGGVQSTLWQCNDGSHPTRNYN